MGEQQNHYDEWLASPPILPGSVTVGFIDAPFKEESTVLCNLTYRQAVQTIAEMERNYDWYVEGIEGHYLFAIWSGNERSHHEPSLALLKAWAKAEQESDQ